MVTNPWIWFVDKAYWIYGLSTMITEHIEQVHVVHFLRRNKLDFFAVPNGYNKGFAAQRKAKDEGLVSGIPDLIILTKTKTGQHVALEMKRNEGPNHGKRIPCKCLDPNQVIWKEKFQQAGWIHILAHGAEDAIAALEELYDIN